MSVARAKCVPSFGPELPEGPLFTANDLFRDFLLTKVINGHNSVPKGLFICLFVYLFVCLFVYICVSVGKFGTLGKEMRFKYLRSMLENNLIENSCVDGSNSRFSILPFRRVEKRRARIPAEIESRGGLVWPIEMLVDDQLTSLILAVSHEVLAVVVPFGGDGGDGGACGGNGGGAAENLELVPGTAIFSIPPRSILGWTKLGENSIEVYFGKGDSFYFSVRRKNDISDLLLRLECSSRGRPPGLHPPAIKSKEINVTRATSGSQLGFHVAYEGFVNQVDVGSAAAKAGLQKGSRIVAIQTKPLSKLSHKQMIEILRTESRVTLRVLPPVGLKEQPRYTPRELANSVPRLPEPISNDERELYTEEDDQPIW